MKKIVCIVFCTGILFSCQETISVDLNESAPRLVVDAKIIVTKDSLYSANVILSTSVPFFENQQNFVNDASVKLIMENGDFRLLRFRGDGEYSLGFVDKTQQKYTLEVIHNDEIYTATEQLAQGVPLEYVEQTDNGGFLEEDIELRAYFNDPAGVQNYYYLEESSENDGRFDVFSDQFFNGNLFFVTFTTDELKPGSEVHFSLYGIDKGFYNFLSLLLQQTGSQGGNPFATPPATVRGNIVNLTNPEHFAFGYFRISEVFTLEYVVE